jgi:hypothetical protein
VGKSNARKGRVLEDWVAKAVAKEVTAREELAAAILPGGALADRFELPYPARRRLAAAILPVAPWGFHKLREDVKKINDDYPTGTPLDAEKIMMQLRAIVAAMPDTPTTTAE